MAKPLVSVIIPNYNYGRYLAEAIESVLSQSYPHVELIVVDDGSTDNSEAILNYYNTKIRCIRQRNQGVSIARNRGVQESRGELIAFLDADDFWLPAKLERQVERMVAEPDVGLVHCGCEMVDEAGVTLSTILDGEEGWIAKKMFIKWWSVLGAGSSIVVTRSTFETIGGFDPRLSTSADWDFSYKAAARQPVAFVKEVLFKGRVHQGSMQSNVVTLEHDMLLAFASAFTNQDPELQALRRPSYAHLHMVLAGSFFRARRYGPFLRHALKSLYFGPGNYSKLLGFPLRWSRRRFYEGLSASATSTEGVD